MAGMAAAPVLAVGLTYRLWAAPYATGQNVVRAQPVPFSHQHHVGGLGIACRYCHTSVEKARFAGLPPTHTCMSCHSQIWTNAEMLAPVRASLATGTPIRWRRVHTLPDYVYFDHSVHVAKGVGCSTCHGAVQGMPLMRQAAPLTMSWCLDCHRNPEPNLRPREEVYDMAWTPPPDQETRGRALRAAYHIRSADRLSECSICHR
ncbi:MULTISPECIES: cytochrome c3 family protein [unclassified Methylobacterium]|uniref:cytochrome c3 family protein n=1 Tax=unclassified Methylobacterium TaxID=2615210 RepID=UPI0006814605|nr:MULTISPECIES: cytochrome c3 family protein [Methylobacterium]WFT83687.1 cytochrome c3 family protein [Methylobacterium nodulans]